MKTFRLYCEILTPIHIGSEEEYDPLEYVIAPTSDGDRFYRLDIEKFLLKGLNDKERKGFEEYADRGDIRGIRQFIRGAFFDIYKRDRELWNNCILYEMSVTDRIAQMYRDNLNNPHSRSQLKIKPFVRSELINRAIIPGSSLKGSIRTAVVDDLAHNGRYGQKPRKITNWNEQKEFESKILGYGRDMKKDLFRTVKLRDANIPEDMTEIVEVKNARFSRRDNTIETISIQMFTEVTLSWGSGYENTFFESELLIDEVLQKHKSQIPITITAKDIVRDCNKFYGIDLEREIRFYNRNGGEEIADLLKQIKEEYDNFKDSDDTFLLRVGRFSGVYAVTLEDFRNPQPPGNKGWGKSRSLAFNDDFASPLGWIKIKMEEVK